MTTGIELIAKERKEQVIKHGISIEDDAGQNSDCELSNGAIAVLLANIDEFPEKWDRKKCRKMMQKSYRKRLVIAGALLAAELDRILLEEEQEFSKKSNIDDLPF